MGPAGKKTDPASSPLDNTGLSSPAASSPHLCSQAPYEHCQHLFGICTLSQHIVIRCGATGLRRTGYLPFCNATALRNKNKYYYCHHSPVLRRISTIASGVHGARESMLRQRRPICRAWNPSTSLLGSTELQMTLSSMCRGSGSWTRMPSTNLLSFSFLIRDRRSVCVVDDGR